MGSCAVVTVPSCSSCAPMCCCHIMSANVLLSLYHALLSRYPSANVLLSLYPLDVLWSPCTLLWRAKDQAGSSQSSQGPRAAGQGVPYPSPFLNCPDSDQIVWHLTLLRRGVSSSGSFSATASQLYAEGGAGAFFKVCCWCAFGVFWCVVGQSYLVTWIDQQR